MFKLKDYKLKDTIAAIATFPSKSALGVIKLSGKKAISIISQIFEPAKKKNIKKAKTFTLHYGWIVDNQERNIDEVLVSLMRKPSSYTKEDVVEISGHGGPVVLNKILELILAKGARLALPGEFTYRALIRGRIDLLQAEAVLGLVEAKTDESLVSATAQLKGQASLRIEKLKNDIKELFSLTESFINFPEADINFSHSAFRKKIDSLSRKVNNLLEGAKEGRIMKEGLKCVICGRANTGKSTLFNRLLKEERVIVSKISGTTRDVIEETINIRGVPLRIYDTAGILEPKDLLAKKVREKTQAAFGDCDLVILVLDASRPLNRDDFFLLEKLEFKNIIFVVNKCDLIQRIDLKKIPKARGPVVKMSALKNTGLKQLEKAVYNHVYKGKLDRENIVFFSQYQSQILGEIKDELGQVQIFLKQGYQWDFINLSLKNCLSQVGKLSGEVFSEEILEDIFSKFCIGK